MWKEVVQVAVAASLWVAATSLMIAATVSGEIVIGGWSILFALWGSIFTVWHLMTVERARTELIARAAAEAAVEYIRLESVK